MRYINLHFTYLLTDLHGELTALYQTVAGFKGPLRDRKGMGKRRTISQKGRKE